MDRKFGVEIELVGISIEQALTVLRSTEVPMSDNTRYRHSDYNAWKVTTDASVSGGCEIVSRILQGEEGIAELKKVAKALSNAGATVNRSCGLHVHVDAHNLSGDNIRHIVTRYAHFESTIDNFMPRSRRGNSNHFCGSMSAQLRLFEPNGHGNRNWWFSNDASMVSGAISSRYMKVNLQSYIRQRTIEFRQHSGSVNANKIATWVKFVLQFVAQSVECTPVSNIVTQTINDTTSSYVDSELPPRRARGYGRNNNIAYKHLRILRKLYANPGTYYTVSQIASFANISESSVPAYISCIRQHYNVTIRNSRRFGYTVPVDGLRVTPAPVTTTVVVPPTAPVISPNDTLWAGIDSSIRSFYEERTMELE